MKLKLKLLNIFYLIFSVVALGAYVLNYSSFVSATFKYKINEEYFLEESIDDSALTELGVDHEDLFSDLDTIIFEVEVNLSYQNLLQAWTETGPDYDRSYMSALERYSAEYVFIPAFRRVSDDLQEDLERVANAAISKMIENTTKEQLMVYSRAVTGSTDYWQAMKDNPENIENYGEGQFIGAVSNLTGNLLDYFDEERFNDGLYDENSNLVLAGLKQTMYPYFTAIKNPADSYEQAELTSAFNKMWKGVDQYLHYYGIFDEEGVITNIEEAIGNVLQRFIDHVEYELLAEEDEGDYVDDYEDDEFYNKFVGKFFAPLKTYIGGDNDFDEDDSLAELFFNVVKNSNINGENGAVFYLIALAARVFGVLLVLFLLAWAIKFISVIISFFRQRPYIRMNPLFIITGTIEALLALLTLGSVIIYQNFDIQALRGQIPLLQAIVPLGLSFRFVFACWIPGVLAILNLLFSIVYGPVKKKFKQDSRDEILYSTDFNDYE